MILRLEFNCPDATARTRRVDDGLDRLGADFGSCPIAERDRAARTACDDEQRHLRRNLRDRRRLGAERQAIARILDIGAGDDVAVLEQQRRADGAVAVLRSGGDGGDRHGGEQRPLGR